MRRWDEKKNEYDGFTRKATLTSYQANLELRQLSTFFSAFFVFCLSSFRRAHLAGTEGAMGNRSSSPSRAGGGSDNRYFSRSEEGSTSNTGNTGRSSLRRSESASGGNNNNNNNNSSRRRNTSGARSRSPSRTVRAGRSGSATNATNGVADAAYEMQEFDSEQERPPSDMSWYQMAKVCVQCCVKKEMGERRKQEIILRRMMDETCTKTFKKIVSETRQRKKQKHHPTARALFLSCRVCSFALTRTVGALPLLLLP